ncbi:GNAT family N-acetyltransferase [Nonomuraea aridisoli]|uniref:GNAT family N-acetyltransferase n=1 Tax=Nonomuraea aridisoli TaxID=2070368 RepID=A0A2W2ELZ0_9ACTN|nr:GNAT family N-acetyltransferase [Nonomuraea aridisoli]PZG13428.1 GNAT family N-acetyltransferase [Nonomuraea aridisoli]
MPAITLKLSVRDLTHDDLASCGWAGPPMHLAHVASALDRRRAGEIDYLAVCPPTGHPVAVGGVDYALVGDAGTLWQLTVHPALRSCGIGSVLIRALERRVMDRGLRRAELSVEEDNPRARKLYERLAYVPCGQRLEAWDTEGPGGAPVRYETLCTVMRKDL